MKRKSYTTREKLCALEALKRNEWNVSKTARELEITPKMLRDWRNKEQFLCESSNHANTRRIGSGVRPSYPALEQELAAWITKERSIEKRLVSFRTLRNKALEISLKHNIELFARSNCWISKFMKRNKLSARKITSMGQADNREPWEIKQVVTDYLDVLSVKCMDIARNRISNMDESPMYIDMMNSRTISFLGEKNTEVKTNGHQKTQFTVVLCVSASGSFLKTMVILKGLKNIPKCHIPKNLIVITSNSGTMDKVIMQTFIISCLKAFGPFKNTEKSLLLLDSYGSHKDTGVLAALEQNNFEYIFIPPKTTSYLQPLDLLVNSVFKSKIKAKWEEWFLNGEKNYTKGGYRQRPSWEKVFNFISSSVVEIEKKTIEKSFYLCGYQARNMNSEIHLNEELRTILTLGDKDTQQT